MKFLIDRIYKGDNYTIGKLYVNYEDDNGYVYVCDTLEDKVREPFVKIPKQTAIRPGTYSFVLDYSKRFKKLYPHILNVGDFEGIRIHSGNTSEHTEGCILLGYNKVRGGLIQSFDCMNKLRKLLKDSKQNQWELIIK